LLSSSDEAGGVEGGDPEGDSYQPTPNLRKQGEREKEGRSYVQFVELGHRRRSERRKEEE